MKLVRFGAPGAEKPGLVDAQGAVRDLSAARQGHHRRHALAREPRQAAQDRRQVAALAPQGVRLGAPVGRRAQLHRRRPQLRRPRQGDRRGDSRRADPVQQAAQLHRRPQRRRDDPQGLDQARLRGRDRLRHRHARPLRRREGRARPTSPATPSATTCPSATSRSSAAASG